MKTRNFFFVSLLATAAAGPAEARRELYDHNGTFFEVLFQGHAVKVAPNLAKVHPTPVNGAPLDCTEVHSVLQRKAAAIEECTGENPPEAICRMLIDGIRLLAEDRPGTDTPIPPSAVQFWQLGAPSLAGIDVAGVRAAVARKYGVPEAAVETVPTGVRARASSTPFFAGAEDSEWRKVGKVLSFDLGDVATLTPDGRLVTRNKIFACDLLEGKAFLHASYTSTMRSVDHVPDEVVDAAWAAYRAVESAGPEVDSESSPYVKGALVGFRVGQALAARAPVEDELLKPGALLRKLLAFDGATPRLLPRASRNELREKTYPDVTLEEPLVQSWRIQ